MKPYFDHEKLNVYRTAIEFVKWTHALLEHVPKKLAAYDHLDRASTSIPLNIAEGNGKFTSSDRCKFLDTARGSALECAAALDVLVARNILSEEAIIPGKEMLVSIVSMLVGLIKTTSPDRVYEKQAEYRIKT